MVSLPLSQVNWYEPPSKPVPPPPPEPLAGHLIASSVREKPAISITTARTAPPAAIAAAALPDVPGEIAGGLIALMRPSNARTPAARRGNPIEKMAKKPRRSSPAAEMPSKSGRQRAADARLESAAQIAIRAMKAATNGTRRNWKSLPPCEPTTPRYRASTAAAMMAAPTPAQRISFQAGLRLGSPALTPPTYALTAAG